MAASTDKPSQQNPEVENPSKPPTLAPPKPSDAADKSKDPNPAPSIGEDEAQPKPQSLSVTVGEEGADGPKSKAAVVSPTADNEVQKKLRRAERFGVPVQLSEEEKRNSRAERFGTSTGAAVSKGSEDQKKKARAERFGTSAPADDEAKKKARLARFGSEPKVDSQEEEKRKARALRFSQASSVAVPVPHITGEGNVEPKPAFEGTTAGGA